MRQTLGHDAATPHRMSQGEVSRRSALVIGSLSAGLVLAHSAGWVGRQPTAQAAPVWNHPFAMAKAPISQYWGPSSDYPDGWHKGLDYAPGEGTQIYSVAAGTVTFAGGDTQYQLGQRVTIAHADGWHSNYGHMITGSIAVALGQTVQAGQPVGQVGNTGWSYGAHLHLELWTSASRANHTDPLPHIHTNAPLADQIPATPIEDDMPTPLYIAASTNSTNGQIKKDKRIDPATGFEVSGVYVLVVPGEPLRELSWSEWEIRYAQSGAPMYKTGDQLAAIAAANGLE
jgi:hypothetical protein